ncbi:hypothetical protein GOV10_06630 [Candidatus Woesearchaeota archaeon]|nr:hypothetical protein [Candidatus Woesearchaeota archaeon]
MKTIIVVLLLAFLIAACGDGATGEVVLDEEQTQLTKLEQEIDSLLGEISSLKDDVETQIDDVREWELANKALETLVAKKEELIGFQKTILREMEDEKNEAVADQEGCDERIEELENANNVLQKWVSICQEELDVALE